MIATQNISLSYSGKPLFKNVNIKFTAGNCYGIIGANGTGKSTFLKVLSGELEPTTGDVVITPGERMAVLKQNHFEFDEYEVLTTVIMGHKRLYEIMKEKDELYAKVDFTDEDGERASILEGEFAELDGWNAESNAEMILTGLGISLDLEHTLMKELDGSQKVKVLLAQALFGSPDILLLDEPTNYLDEEHISWLKRYLVEYENAFILISHDIPFLNSVINIVYHMENRKLTRYVGNYDRFQEVYAIQKAQIEAAYERQQQEIRELKDFVNRNKARVATRNMAMSRQKKLDKMERIELTAEKPKPYHSYGNGSAMRVSSVAWMFDTIEEVRRAARLSAEVTHNHPEGIKGAEVTAGAIFLARAGATMEQIKSFAECFYDLDFTIDEIRPTYYHKESCQETVPEAIVAFLESTDFEDAIRNAVSLGGDCDTLTCITGSIAEAFYGVPEELKRKCRTRLPDELEAILLRFESFLKNK